MKKMKNILLAVFVAVTVFCNSGYGLRCYNCEQSPYLCRTNTTCTEEEDACLQIRFVHLRTYSCWKMSQCTTSQVADHFNADSFRFLCCQRDFCNRGVNILVGTAPLVLSALTVVWMMLLY